ncbi:Tetracycline repressor protein class E [Corynebacterium ciconiae DSM 44920]|uniref:TetR/AcrR family transcriptional regulator n=1 Tax=Corynebacterium ciconiae TaxID=227319 RepID=UPI00037D3BF8|nr:TetR family transcriptional regulator [Corynebacterium ciconiae]WKD60818.1 Tetracycline repressor protein class E [Corynebacterium ciconiae DSM 44920]
MQLSKQAIIDSAMTILDTFGLADMTMRRVAKHLGVAPGALYWHVPSKQALIAEIAQKILEPACVQEPEGGVDKRGAIHLLTAADRLRACLNAHRDGAEIVSAALAQPELAAQAGAIFSAHLPADVAAEQRADMAAVFVHYVIGAVLAEQSTRALTELASSVDESGAHLQEVDYSARFELGAQLLVKGINSENRL